MSAQSFNDFLRKEEVSNELRSLLYHIVRSVKYINQSIRAGNTGVMGTENIQGEEQLALDVLADNIIHLELENSGLVSVLASEEKDDLEQLKPTRGEYAVTYDPLDGSSLVDANLSIGSIFAVWENADLIGQTGEGIVASCYAVYGPRVIVVVAIKEKGVHEFELNDVGEFLLTRESLKVADDTIYFAPGNLRACSENPKYHNLILHWLEKRQKLRYSGGMVPDLHHILSKGQGIFTYPRDEEHQDGKLRLLFECAPFAFVFEEAGGVALDQEGERILEAEIKDIHQRIPIFIGSRNQVRNAVEFLR